MTREEAKNILAEHIKLMEQENEPSLKEDIDALKMAIQALKNHDTYMKYSYEQGKQDALSQEPTSEMVHVETLHQVMWERDIAIGQLKELGYSFGQKIEPCNDVISREAVDDILCLYSDKNGMIDARGAVRMVRELPPVNPQKSGKCLNKDDFIYALKTCEYTVHNGQVMYAEEDLIKRFKDLEGI